MNARARVVQVCFIAAIASGSVDVQTTARRSDPVLDDFHARTEQYMKIRRALEAAAGGRQEIAIDQSANEGARRHLAEGIQDARRDARRGDIFTPAISARIRHRLDAEVRGLDAASTRSVIREDGPPAFALRVNDSYPFGALLPTVPGNVLAVLPALPDGLEYRIVDSSLIIRDVDANLIVDYLVDVMCHSC